MSWTVYAISAEHEEDDPFYIGITSNFQARCSAHNRPDSAAYDQSKAYEAIGIDCIMVPLAEFETQAEARAYETAMIALHRRLVNRDVAIHTRAFMAKHYGSAAPGENNNVAWEQFLAETVAADG